MLFCFLLVEFNADGRRSEWEDPVLPSVSPRVRNHYDDTKGDYGAETITL